jgi:4-hydroxybenzoate polyprenyltransferase
MAGTRQHRVHLTEIFIVVAVCCNNVARPLGMQDILILAALIIIAAIVIYVVALIISFLWPLIVVIVIIGAAYYIYKWYKYKM